MKNTIIGLLLFLLIMMWYKGKRNRCTEIVKEITQIDTIYIKAKIPPPVKIDEYVKEIIVTQIKDSIVNDTVYVNLPINRYQDSIFVDEDSAMVHYDHIVAGDLLRSDYRFDIPINQKIIEREKTIYREPLFKVFAVGSFKYFPAESESSRFGVGLDFVGRDIKIGFKIGEDNIGGFNQLTHTIEIGYKLWQF